MRRTTLVMLLLALSCGPVDTGSRNPPLVPDSTVGGIGVWYYPGATALDRAQLDETLRLHACLTASWAPIHGATYPPQLPLRVQWYSAYSYLTAWRRTVTFPVHDHRWVTTRGVTGVYVPSTRTLHLIATAKNTTSRDNGASVMLLHAIAGDWVHSHPCWVNHQYDGLTLDILLEVSR